MVELEKYDLEIHLEHLRGKYPDSDVIALHFEGRPPVERLDCDGETWRVRRAVSELGLRSILVEDGREPTLVLTPRRNSELEDDLLARLGGMAVHNVDIWQRLAMLFEATGTDAKLKNGDHADGIARTLLKSSSGGFAPVSAGFLDERTAWETIQRHALDQRQVAEEMSDWLVWAVASKRGVVRLFEEYTELIGALADWLEDQHPKVGRYFVELLERGAELHRPGKAGVEAMATGLALDAAIRAREQGHIEEAAYLTKGLKAQGLDDQGRRFAEVCREAWTRLAECTGESARQAVRRRVDELFTEHGGGDYRAVAACSGVSETGWNERVRAVVDSVEELLEEGPAAVDQVRHQLDKLGDHASAQSHSDRIEQLRLMAALAYRLADERETSENLTELGEHYVRDGSFIDAARERVTAMDAGEETATLRSKLISAALKRSDELNCDFSALLATELEDRSAPRQGLGPQEVIQEVVAPIAGDHPVLMVVLDGLNWAVARWLMFDGELPSWERWVPADKDGIRPMYAAIPSETKYSRTSLLTGKLQSGTQHVEKKEFPGAIRDAGGVDKLREAVLFHKKEIDAAGPGQVGREVRDAILNPERRIVGVVVNAIDDQLSGAEQVAIKWSVDVVTPLRTLLELAKQRVVVLVGDHGHVWETETDYAKVGGTSARWRPISDERIEGERKFSGPMISEFTGEPEILTAWSERVRYTLGSAGYHGGVSMQEILTPLIVMTPPGKEIELRNCRALNARPNWWELREAPREAEFGEETPESPAQLSLVEPRKPGVDTGWIERLVETPAFERQLRRHGDGIEAELVAEMLAHLHANGDKLSVEELADLVDLPVRRLERRLPLLTSVVNREGYRSVRYNRVEHLVELNRPLLERQFEL